MRTFESQRVPALLPPRRTSSDLSMWSPGRPAPAPVEHALRSPGQELPGSVIDESAPFGRDFSGVRVHTDVTAADAAMVLNARAFTVGTDIVFGPGQFQPGTARGRALLHHELVHVTQGESRRGDVHPVMAELPSQEREASLPMRERTRPANDNAPQRKAHLVQRHPAEKVLRFAAKWLTKRSAKHITKHIARHTRKIADRAIHSIFRNPRAVKYTVTRAVREALEVVQRNATTAVTEVVEEGTIRITRQATRTPGKFRWVIEKTFTDAIGTAGERILRIVIDQTGRIVTAFPTDRLAVIGLTVAGIEAFTARTAEAAETVGASVERQTALEVAASQPPESSWWEWVPIIGDIWCGELNSGENEWLAARDEGHRRDKLVQDVVAATVADIEADLQSTLGPEKRADVEEFIRMDLASGVDLAEEE